MIKIFRLNLIKKFGSIVIANVFIFQLSYPTISYALTSGPSQPEVQSFEPVSTTQMVDPFTGDFTYNIPLLDVGGYPINISYHAGIGMDQEASWVGLGWNINPGVINRNMRGIPDDFKGDVINKTTNINQYLQVGFDPRFKNVSKSKDEMFGAPDYSWCGDILSIDEPTIRNTTLQNRTLNYIIYYNNYKGVGFSITSSLPVNSTQSKSKQFQGQLGFGFDSQEGISITPSLSFDRNKYKKLEDNNKIKLSASVSIGFSSRNGLQSVGIGKGISRSKKSDSKLIYTMDQIKEMKSGGFNNPSMYSFQNQNYTPVTTPNTYSYNYSFNLKMYDDKTPTTSAKAKIGTKIDAFVSVNGVYNSTNQYNAYGFNNEHLRDETSILDLNDEEQQPFNKFTNNLRPSISTYDILNFSGQGFGGSYKPSKNYLSSLSKPKVITRNLSKPYFPIEYGVTQPPKPEYGRNLQYKLDGKIYEQQMRPAWGKSLKIGVDPKLTYVWGESSLWDAKEGNNVLERFDKHRIKDNINTLNEGVFYKSANEKTVYDKDFYNSLGSNYAIKMEINATEYNEINEDHHVIPNFKLSNGVNLAVPQDGIAKKGRTKRSEVVNYLSAKEAEKFALERDIFSYSYNTSNNLIERTPIQRVSNMRKGHHISEVTSLTSEGVRYVYGLPVYNYNQIESQFNIGEKNAELDYFKNGIVNFSSTDNSVDNVKGIDHFYHSESMPSYVHSWMLTAVLSSDYIDVTGDGPSNDDFGTYTKFNYQKLMVNQNPDHESNFYDWRFPYNYGTGNFNRGLKCDELDDKASFISGKKEVWYLQSIETKTHIAIFHLSDRLDGYDAPISSGQIIGNMVLKKLDKIELFNIVDFYTNSDSRVPLKVVNFEYSYDLCPGILNNNLSNSGIIHPLNSYNSSLYSGDLNSNKGKLTLHKIWFTNGKSNKGSLSPYIFEYKSSLNSNPAYSAKSVDRWGNYKPWNYENSLTGTETFNGSQNNLLSNAEYPYVPQYEDLVDEWAGVWCLSDIKLPSGGKMKIEYESDDYSHVQNKEAMQMVKIKGFMDNLNGTIKSQLYDFQGGKTVNNYLLFEWPDGATEDEVFGSLNRVYGSFYVSLNRENVPLGYDVKKEHIQAYLDIDGQNRGKTTINSTELGYIKIKPSYLGDKDNTGSDDDMHIVTKQALQFARESASHLAFPGSNVRRGDNTIKSILGNVISVIPEVVKTLIGFDKYHVKYGYACDVELNNSFIKLNSPNKSKKGGGHRVKRITINDNWNSMSSTENDLITGQEFEYTCLDDQGVTQSSGVASYEPLVGGDENVWRDKSFSVVEKDLFGPDNYRYDEGPIGESFMPAALVGYSRICIKNIKPSTDENVLAKMKKHGTGKIVYEFFTAKDFPIIPIRTGLDVYIRKNLALSLLGYNKEKTTATQGFLIELNDMHGKLKSILNYNEYDDEREVSGTKYDYYVEKEGATPLQLKNNVTVIDKSGQKIDDQLVGVEIEAFNYSQRSEHNALSGAAEINFHAIYPNSLAPPIIPLFSVVPTMSYSRSVVQQITITKVLNRYGLLKKITVIDENSELSTINEAWDAETGEVILSKTQNEYNDWDYELTKPAHWVEQGMAGAYQNIDAELLLTTNTINPGEVEMANLSGFGISSDVTVIDNILHPGDELIAVLRDDIDLDVANKNDDKKYWVLTVSNGKANLIDELGNPISYNSKPYFFKIARSGHRNLLTSPAEVITTQINPISTSNWSQLASIDNVINGSALLYSDKWQIYYQKEMIARLNCELAQDPIYEEIENNSQDPLFTLPPGGSIVDFRNSTNWPLYSICDGKIYYSPGQSVNPYLLGIRGIWRPWYSMVYYDRTNAKAERTLDWTSNDPNLINVRGTGLINSYVPFYQMVAGKWMPQWTPSSSTSHDQWTWQNRATLIGPNGEEVENVDAMGIPSSALYGYQKTLPIAVCANSNYQDMMFDGFEEYDLGYYNIDCAPNNTINFRYFPLNNSPAYTFYNPYDICSNVWHWPLWKALANGNARVTDNVRHTGKQSLMIAVPEVGIVLENNDALGGGNYPISGGKYFLNPQDFIKVFYPKNSSSNQSIEFLISYWVFGNGTIQLRNSTGSNLSITQIGNPITIDGWTRFEGKITIPANSSINELLLINNNIPYPNNGPVISQYPPGVQIIRPIYFDDVRIFPYKGNMNSYVYNKINKRLMATLSENNFATFYEYDEEGNLIRTKVETAKGIMTVQENRSSLRKK